MPIKVNNCVKDVMGRGILTGWVNNYVVKVLESFKQTVTTTVTIDIRAGLKVGIP